LAELDLLHEAVVGEEEIDELGHMNVRFYLAKALAASDALAARVGLSRERCEALGAVLELRDVYTRHRAEQMQGAKLEVRGGVLDVRSDGLRLYHELVNPERGELAASFVHAFSLRDQATRAERALPEHVAEQAGAVRVEWPEHGRSRSIDLDTEPPRVALSLLRERDLAMRVERTVEARECDAEGHYLAAGYQELFWGGEPVEERKSASWLVDLEGGGKMGWATLESRGLLYDLPRVGTRIQSFGAEVALSKKISFRHHWVFDVDREALLATSTIVNLAFDIGARRAIEIPDHVKTGLEARYHPDLR
jgi:acyl-CoA thioester hydrolase